MPGGDKTGPRGQGSRTGRGLGNCPPSSATTGVPSTTASGRPLGLGGQLWNATFGRLFRRRRSRRSNWNQ